MTGELEIHEACDSEREAAFRNVYEVWPRGRTLDEHMEFRRHSPRHEWARWYVGVLDGQVVTSLGCHPMKFRIHGEVHEGIGIAAVHTLSDFRRRGFAERLIEWVETRERAGGIQLAMLFSDIGAGYYARLGYQLCPGNEGLTSVENGLDETRESGARLVAFDAADNLGRMNELYVGDHGHRPASIERTDAYWKNILARHPDDEFFWLIDEKDKTYGYVRLGKTDQMLKITDLALSSDAADRIVSCYRAVISLARSRGLTSVGGWLPDTPATRNCFAIRPRELELTMLKPLGESLALDDEVIAATDYFHETDHV